jgi:hypothetical protein
MDRQSVESSSLRSVGYDPQTETLEIEFHNGRVYQYFEVPLVVYQELLQAESLGRYFQFNLRDAYRYQRMA